VGRVGGRFLVFRSAGGVCEWWWRQPDSGRRATAAKPPSAAGAGRPRAAAGQSAPPAPPLPPMQRAQPPVLSLFLSLALASRVIVFSQAKLNYSAADQIHSRRRRRSDDAVTGVELYCVVHAYTLSAGAFTNTSK
jgi:hypothetical protein